MSEQYPFSTKQERGLLELLKKEGPMLHNDLITHGKKESGRGFSETQLNTCLNEMVRKDWVFRIERQGKFYYRINDFPLNVQKLIAVLRSCEQYDPQVKLLTQKYVEWICLFHGVLPEQSIFSLALADVGIDMELAKEPVWRVIDQLEGRGFSQIQAQFLRQFMDRLKR
jgi:hypothetical protein